MQFYQILFVLIATSCLGDLKTIRNSVQFQRLGTYTIGNVEKTYWVPRHMKALWHLTRPICKAHDFDILTIDTLDEWKGIAELCEARKELFDKYIHVGGIAGSSKAKTNWYWVVTNTKISDDMPWSRGAPTLSPEWCLALYKAEGFKFDEIDCYKDFEERFICESIRELDANVDVKVGTVKIEEVKVVQ